MKLLRMRASFLDAKLQCAKLRCSSSLSLSLLALLITIVPLHESGNSPVFAAEIKASASLDQQKLDIAKHLTDWMQSKLQSEKALVAVVSRKGGKDLKSRDKTGMAHSGLAIYDPRAQSWILYQILNVPKYDQPVAELWRSAPVNFFYAQTGYEENALILIPDEDTQRRIYASVLSGDAWKMAFTPRYNLLSTYDTNMSLNCNKWILMTIAAARTDDYDPEHVLNQIRNGFEPAKLHLNLIEKEIAKRKPNVRRGELPRFGSVETVTPESLLSSGLFPKHFFMHSVPLK
jgi:hypothetical protein